MGGPRCSTLDETGNLQDVFRVATSITCTHSSGVTASKLPARLTRFSLPRSRLSTQISERYRPLPPQFPYHVRPRPLLS